MVVQFVAPKTILFSALPIDWYFNYVIKNACYSSIFA